MKRLRLEDKATVEDLIKDLEDVVLPVDPSIKKKIVKLKSFVPNDMKSFVRYYKRISGATDWDLPDNIFAYSE